MNSINEAKQKLGEIQSKSTFEKMVQVAAILTKLKRDLTKNQLDQSLNEI
ncbi:hypothetical protein [Neobacillus vireti]